MTKSAKRSALGRLLHGRSPSVFLERYWSHRHLAVKAPVSRMPELFGAPELQSVESVLESEYHGVRGWFTDRKGAARSADLTAASALTLYRTEILTLVVDSLRLPPVERLMQAMRRELATPQTFVGCNVYMSPAGAGTRMHFDEQDIFLVQIRGRKRWRIAPCTQIREPMQPHFAGAKMHPENALLAPKLPTRMPRVRETVVLEPGSVLYMPAGYWHASETIEDSIALTLTFPSICWLDLMLTRLRHRLVQRERWRARAVGILAPPSPRQRRALEHMQGLLDELAEDLASTNIVDLLS